MILEFQVSQEVFGRIIRNQFHRADLCVNQQFTRDRQAVMINRIRVDRSTQLRNEPSSFDIRTEGGQVTITGSRAIVAQPLVLEVVSVTDVEANGPNPTAPDTVQTITVLINVVAMVEAGRAKLQVAFREVDYGEILGVSIDNATKSQINAFVQSQFPPINRDLDFSSLQSLAPGLDLTATNAGAVVASEGDALFVRVEVGGDPAAVERWTVFHNFYDRNLVSGTGWALLVDSDLLAGPIGTMIRGQLAGAGDQFALKSDVRVVWNPVAGPIFDVTFSGEFIDACTCLWGEVDVDVDVFTRVLLQAVTTPAGDILRTRIHVTYDADDLEVFCCALTAGIFWPVVGLIYLGRRKLPFAYYLGGLIVGPLGVFIAACVNAGNQGVSNQTQCNKVDDETVDCDTPVAISLPDFGSFRLRAVTPNGDGPVLSGPVEVLLDLHDSELVVTEVKQFQWGLGGDCTRGFEAKLRARVRCRDAASPGSILKICDATVLDDPVKAFPKVVVTGTDISIEAEPSPAYLAAPYPCRLRIVSNGGVRILTLRPARRITAEESLGLTRQMRTLEDACFWARTGPVPGFRRVEWVLGPDPAVESSRLWHVIMSGLAMDDRVELLGRDDVVLSMGRPSRTGVVLLSHWSEGAGHLDEIGVRLSASEGAGDLRRRVAQKQVELVLRSRVAVSGALSALTFTYARGRTLLAMRTSAGEMAYDVTAPAAPLPVSVPASVRFPARGLCQRRVRDSPDGNKIVDYPESPLSTLEGIAQDAIAAVGDFLLLLCDDLAPAWEVLLLDHWSGVETARIVQVKVPGVTRAVALMERDGTTRVIDAGDTGALREITRYHARPWFIGSVRSGKTFARLSDDGADVAVYEINRVKLI